MAIEGSNGATPVSDCPLPIGEREEILLGHGDAVRIGRVVEDHPGFVVLRTPIGGDRVLDLPFGEALPRIC